MSNTTSQARIRKGTAVKASALDSSIHLLEDHSVEKRLDKFARCMVLPGEATPQIMPSPLPGRCGVARFPLTVTTELTPSASVLCMPSTPWPLRVTSDSELNFNNRMWYGETSFDGTSSEPHFMDMQSHDNYVRASSVLVVDTIALPMEVSAELTVNARLTIVPSNYQNTQVITMEAYTGSSWDLVGTTPRGLGNTSPNLPLNGTLPANTIAIRFRADGLDYPLDFQFSLAISGAGTWRPTGTRVENVYKMYAPEYNTVLEASSEWRVVAMDCLATFSGAILSNSGVIGACNADGQLVQSTSMYDTILKRPFDNYSGRLASTGDSPGGAHWHYVPGDLSALQLSPKAARRNDFVGYIGLAGRQSGQPVKITMNIVVNYFTVNPAFNMKIQPDYLGFSELIEFLRRDVPLVTCNDQHAFEKLLQLAKRTAGKAAKHALNNPDQVVRVLKMIAPLVL